MVQMNSMNRMRRVSSILGDLNRWVGVLLVIGGLLTTQVRWAAAQAPDASGPAESDFVSAPNPAAMSGQGAVAAEGLMPAQGVNPASAINNAMSSAGPGKTAGQKQYQFGKDDFVKVTMGTVRGLYYKDRPATFFVGEPVVVPLVLSNHTKFPITIQTDFNPRSNLKVMVLPEGQGWTRYTGPSLPGSYLPAAFYFYPFEEYSTNLVFWGDSQSPTGLAFSQPGVYTVKMELTFDVLEGGKNWKLPIGPFTFTVLDTPPEFKPFVDKLIKDKAADDLNLHKTPEVWQGEIAKLALQSPPNLFTPYLAYAAGDYYAIERKLHSENKEIADNALKFLQIAALSSSPFKDEAYLDLLSVMDQLGLAIPAAQVARNMLQVISPDRIGRIGQLKVLQRYLINTREIDPIHYWTLLQ